MNVCFQQLRNFRSHQQCDIILSIKVFNTGNLLRIIMLICSCGQGDPLEFSLLILSVMYLYVGGFKWNTFKGSFTFFIQAEISNYRYLLFCLKTFSKNEWHASLLKPALTVSSFKNIYLQYTLFFNKQHFYNQCQAEISQKLSKC